MNNAETLQDYNLVYSCPATEAALEKRGGKRKAMKLWASLTAWRRSSEGLNYFTSYCWFCFFTSVLSGPSLGQLPLRHAGRPFVYVFILSLRLRPCPGRRVSSVPCLFGSHHSTPTPHHLAAPPPRRAAQPPEPRARRRHIHFHTHGSR